MRSTHNNIAAESSHPLPTINIETEQRRGRRNPSSHNNSHPEMNDSSERKGGENDDEGASSLSSFGEECEPLHKRARHGDPVLVVRHQENKGRAPTHPQTEKSAEEPLLSVSDRSSPSTAPCSSSSDELAENDRPSTKLECDDDGANESLNRTTRDALFETKGKLSRAKERNGILSNRLERAERELKTLRGASNEELSQTKIHLRSSQKTVSLLTDSLEEAQQRLAELSKTEQKNTGSEQESPATIAELTKAKEQLSNELAESNKKLEEAQSQLEEMQKSAASRIVSLAESESMLRSTNKTVSLLTQSLDEARSELAALRGSSSTGTNRVSSDSNRSQSPRLAGFQTAGAPCANLGEDVVVESEELSLEVAGRVIGRGGEIVRDLRARSGVRIDVNQSPLPGQPRRITYQGPRAKVEFAKKLVQMIAAGASDSDLPLGEAKRAVLTVSSSRIGKIIGRGGAIVREMQSRSSAKIDFHGNTVISGVEEKNAVVITGTEDAVTKAKEMILFLSANPDMDAVQLLNVLVDEKLHEGSRWGSGHPYPNLPNQGSGMRLEMFNKARRAHDRSFETPLVNSAAAASDSSSSILLHMDPSQSCDMMLCKRSVVGRIIGSKGSTIQDLQQRSGTVIHIKQDVPFGADCEVNISGPQEGVKMAKQMIQQIIDGGADQLFGLGRNAAATASSCPVLESSVSRPSERATRWHDRRPQPTDAADWRRMTSPSGQSYYWNTKTGATQWEKPSAFVETSRT